MLLESRRISDVIRREGDFKEFDKLEKEKGIEMSFQHN